MTTLETTQLEPTGTKRIRPKTFYLKEVTNGFTISVSREDDRFECDDFVYLTLDNVIEKLVDVFEQNGK